MYYIGLDVHKKTISYCVKNAAGRVLSEGKIGSTRRELDAWVRTLPQPRMMAMEATIFTGWIYDYLLPHAEKLKVAHPLMLRAIAAAKKKNDKIDAAKIADCLRCDFLPECHIAPTEIRDRRRVLRYRNLVVKQMAQMKNRVSGLLMETGVSYNKQRLHKVGYFGEITDGTVFSRSRSRSAQSAREMHLLRVARSSSDGCCLQSCCGVCLDPADYGDKDSIRYFRNGVLALLSVRSERLPIEHRHGVISD